MVVWNSILVVMYAHDDWVQLHHQPFEGATNQWRLRVVHQCADSFMRLDGRTSEL